jgi:(2Fe-2S) ferredoxin
VSEGEKVSGVLRKMWKGEGLSIDSKRGMYKGIVSPMLLYGSESWATSAAERRRMEVMEMKCMRAMCGITIMNRVRNEDVRSRCGSEVSIGERMDRNVLRWYGHVDRMEEERIVKRVYSAKVEGGRARRGRPEIRSMDGVGASVRRKGMNIEDAKRCAQIVVNGGGLCIRELRSFV